MTRTEPSRPQIDWQLADWLAWQGRLNPHQIELGLDRTREVAQRLQLLPVAATTITVAGTNGKGSSATLAAAIYWAAGYRVGCYTSPHLLRYNERIALDGEMVPDGALCEAFVAIERARREVPLTYFEYGTLAALWLFRRAQVDVQVLEVGLGGRLDAVNIIDADCALLTNIGLDHTNWLGPDRESIGREKAGIFRHSRPAVCVDPQLPLSVSTAAADLNVDLRRLDIDFSYTRQAAGWCWRGRDGIYLKLPLPGLPGEIQVRNAAGVLAVIEALQVARSVNQVAIAEGLRELTLPGRLQRHADLLLDVAHNAEAAQTLVDYLRAQPASLAPRYLVLGMLADKPVEAVGALLSPWFERLYAAGLPPPRGLSGVDLQQRLATVGIAAEACEDVPAALSAARTHNVGAAPIMVCGSFLTVAAAHCCA